VALLQELLKPDLLQCKSLPFVSPLADPVCQDHDNILR
jgi:hypothetical protein